MNRENRSFRCLMVIFIALLSMSVGLAQEPTTTTTTDGGSSGVVESVTTESTNTNVTERPATQQPATETRVTVDQTEVAGTATQGNDNQTLFIVGGLILLGLVGLMVMMAGKRNTSVDTARTSTTNIKR